MLGINETHERDTSDHFISGKENILFIRKEKLHRYGDSLKWEIEKPGDRCMKH